MGIAADLVDPTTGSVLVFGTAPGSEEAHRRTAFLAQEKPLYRRFTVAETLRLGRELNPGWDQRAAESIVRAGNVREGGRGGARSAAASRRPQLSVVR